MPQLCCEIIFLAASEGLVAFPSVPFPQSLFPGDTKSQLEKGSPDKGQGIVPGMYKYLSVVFPFSPCHFWGGECWGSASPVAQFRNNSFHCFIFCYAVQNSFLCVSFCSAESFCSKHAVKRDPSRCLTPRQLQFGFPFLFYYFWGHHFRVHYNLVPPKAQGAAQSFSSGINSSHAVELEKKLRNLANPLCESSRAALKAEVTSSLWKLRS